MKRRGVVTVAAGLLASFAFFAAPGAARERDGDQAERVQDRVDRVARRVEHETRERETGRADAGETHEREIESGTGEAREVAEREAGGSRALDDIARIEEADHDDRGFPARRGELAAMDLSDAAMAAAGAQGFTLIWRHRLAAAGHELLRLGTPRGMSLQAARILLRRIAPDATVDLVHYYGLGLAAGEKPHRLRGGGIAARSLGSMTVGMIDTGVVAHEALGHSHIVAWRDGAQPGAPSGHGTAVASLIAAQGLATIYAANIFRGPPARPFTSADVIAEALGWMIENRVPVINMSLSGPRNAILDQLVRDALSHGQTVVAAAGNGGPTAPPAWPAAVPGVVAVTAVDDALRIYRYASRGRHIFVAARGVDVVAAQAPGGYARFTGTSFATPHIAGWLGRCRADGMAAAVCVERLRKAARDLGAPGYDDVYGYGYIE